MSRYNGDERKISHQRIETHECNICEELYDSVIAAKECCDPRVVSAWECTNWACGRVWRTEGDAKECCPMDDGEAREV